MLLVSRTRSVAVLAYRRGFLALISQTWCGIVGMIWHNCHSLNVHAKVDVRPYTRAYWLVAGTVATQMTIPKEPQYSELPPEYLTTWSSSSASV
jgi:hypothetical protein